VKPLVLTAREPPEQRLDLSPLVPHRLAGKTVAQIAAIELQTTRQRITVGDVFGLRMGDVNLLHIENACDRFDGVGEAMSAGEIHVDGDVGQNAGRLMSGGLLVIHGDAGPWAGSGMTGGCVEISGSAGDRLGGSFVGETAGMRGGVIVVRGDAGERAGDHMRRGTILIEGAAGAYAGSRMIAGTVLVRGRAGPRPGYLMQRGTIVLGQACDLMSPTFVDCGVHELVAMRLMAAFIREYSTKSAVLMGRPLRRMAGDMAVLGKGEIFSPIVR
jgi:formylmethanofuran dehydrogenase subunit C